MSSEISYPYTKHILIGILVCLALFLGFSKLLLEKGDTFIREMAAQSAIVRGDDMLKGRNYSSAEQEFKAYALLAPEDYRAVSRLAEVLILRGEIEESRIQAERALALADTEEQVTAFTRLARAQLGTASALPTAERAWEAASESERDGIVLIQAHAHRRIGQYDVALEKYRTYLEAHPDSGEGHYGLAKSLEGAQSFGELRAEWAQVAQRLEEEHTPDYENVVSRNRTLSERFGKMAEAGELSGKDLEAWGVALKDNGHWELALGHFKQARVGEDVTAEILFWLGVDAESRGNTDEAKKLYRGALAIQATHEKSQHALERLGA